MSTRDFIASTSFLGAGVLYVLVLMITLGVL